MHAIMSDPQAMRYWVTPPHGTTAETERWIARMMAADLTKSDDFIVTLDGRVIGKLGAWTLPDVGFLFDRAHWSRGYASEALAAFIGRRRSLGSTELTADVDPRNGASLKLLGRHGFTVTHEATRTWLVGDEWCDSVYLKLNLTT